VKKNEHKDLKNGGEKKRMNFQETRKPKSYLLMEIVNALCEGRV
jgi:hypothetical protein